MATTNRERILFLLNYLMTNTDEEHELSTGELCAVYQEHGFNGYRKTVKNDALALQEAGFGVCINSNNGQADTFCYVEKNDFDAAEIKMLIDAVYSARFISEEKASSLIEKLLGLTCTARSGVMTQDGMPARIHKSDNHLMQVIDTLEKAIKLKLKVQFQYYDYNLKLEKVLHNNGEVYTFSPYSFKWEQDRYYILGTVDKRPGIINPFRVDLICNPKILSDDTVPPPADFIPSDYSDRVFRMYSGQPCEVVLEADGRLIKKFVDRFGDKFKSEDVGGNRFRATVHVEASPTFYSWVFQYNGGINIISPANIRDEYLAMLRRVTQYAVAVENQNH